MAVTFDEALRVVLGYEGGYSNDPNDHGGATMWGVTQGAYDAYRIALGRPKQPVKKITREEMRDLYYKRYWLAAGCDKLSDSLSLIQFDTAVNFGVGRAKEFLKASGNDLQRYYELRKNYRQKRVKEDPSQAKYLKGWNNRDLAILRSAENYSSPNLAGTGATLLSIVLIISIAIPIVLQRLKA